MKLSQAVDLYIQRKQGAGMRFVSPRNRLRSFLRHCGDTDLRRITTQQVTAFLNGSGIMPSGWNGKRGTLYMTTDLDKVAVNADPEASLSR